MQRFASDCIARSVLLAGALLGVAMGSVQAAISDTPTPAVLLAQAERLQLMDRAGFSAVLRQLHQEESQLSTAQRWQLRYLDAYQASLEGNLTKEAPILHDIIDHSGDAALMTRATAKLITGLAIDHHYEEAFKLANALMAELPQVTDANARAQALRAIVQMLDLAGATDQALKYARQLDPEGASLENRCGNYSYKINAISFAVTLSSDDPGLRRAIAVCLADKQSVYADTLRLTRADLLNEEGHSDQAIALLKSIKPSILRSGFQSQVAGLNVSLAQAYASQGNDVGAKQAALAAVAASDPRNFTWPLLAAYQLLYEIEKRAGDDRAALGYHEKYVIQYKADMDNAKTRALAYQMVKQDVLAKKVKLDALGRQNRILELRQALAGQAQRNSRLFIALLLVVIAFIVAALFWLRRSQLRFRRMARHDGLTASFNREYFFDEAERTLRRLQRAGVDACLVVLDLDHFKQVNDTCGHAAGDEVLRRTVAVCRRELRESDVFGRLGGEEFGILVPHCSHEQGIDIATRIRNDLAATPIVLASGSSVSVSASFGLAYSSTSGYELQRLFSDADAALYRAKDSGRNQVAVDSGGDGRPSPLADAQESTCA
ncbi:MAG TPA: GGDEF domain-containing protein [Rhodanobacter sp.]|nr:GGDEF domain-containing protein [Rhodanobacter sp.]